MNDEGAPTTGLGFPDPRQFFSYTVPEKWVATLSQNFSKSLHKHRTCQDWRVCHGICPAFVYIYLAQKPDISSCIRSNRVRLGLVAEIQNIFGTVHKGFHRVPMVTLCCETVFIYFFSREIRYSDKYVLNFAKIIRFSQTPIWSRNVFEKIFCSFY